MSPPRLRYPRSPQCRSARIARTRHYAMTAPDLLRRRVRHQPVDGHLDARRHPRRREPVGDPAPDIQGTRPHRRAGRARRRPARHGVRRQRRPAGRTARPSSPGSPTRSARANPPPTPSGWRATATQPAETRHVNEGQGDLLVVGSIMLAGYGFRTDAGRTTRSPPIVGMPVRQPRTGRSAVLPPRHRARGARRHHHRLLPAGVQRRSRGRSCSSCSPTPSRWPAPTRTCSASTPCPTASTSCCPPPPPASPSSFARPGSGPIGVDLSELLKGGGSVKCCTLEVHP